MLAQHVIAKSENLKAQQNVASTLADHQQQVRIIEELKGVVAHLENEISKSKNLLIP